MLNSRVISFMYFFNCQLLVRYEICFLELSDLCNDKADRQRGKGSSANQCVGPDQTLGVRTRHWTLESRPSHGSVSLYG